MLPLLRFDQLLKKLQYVGENQRVLVREAVTDFFAQATKGKIAQKYVKFGSSIVRKTWESR